MPKSIKIDDDIYEKLKNLSDRDFRSLSQEIAFLMNHYENAPQQEKNDNKIHQTANNIEVETKSQEVGDLIRKMNQLKFQLRDEQLVQWCQKMAIEECWTEEEAKIETDNHKSELERHLELVIERLNKLGMHI